MPRILFWRVVCVFLDQLHLVEGAKLHEIHIVCFYWALLFRFFRETSILLVESRGLPQWLLLYDQVHVIYELLIVILNFRDLALFIFDQIAIIIIEFIYKSWYVLISKLHKIVGGRFLIIKVLDWTSAALVSRIFLFYLFLFRCWTHTKKYLYVVFFTVEDFVSYWGDSII